ncbi:alpha/beta hydrolase [Paenibacillus protaetiae]|uniref:Alpha/beta hydrolase n=1 Tax=Paenibacillus protaetiae TaxID=2509456 RepID=A0A4P6FCD3_9BACL|nr:alpha/beta hydrolase [Paenibacillus protaetiae]QAY68218.1 alpha/beta hydrolase [Paenibacillus protaetiae]
MNTVESVVLWPEGHPLAPGPAEGQVMLTPYLLPSHKPLAAVIVLPGGGYARRAEHEGKPIAEWLNRTGIHSFVLDYRVAPNRHPLPLADAQRAIRYVRCHAEQYGVDPERVGIVGFSAGGHLASTAGTHFDLGDAASGDPVERYSSRPDLMVLGYPVISFGEFRHNGSKANLIGEDAPDELVQLLSNDKQVTPQTPPAFLWHTEDDGAVPVENSLLFAAALRRNGVPHEVHVFESGRHGLGLAEGEPETYMWPLLCANWLRRRGFIR